jgi:hypothetical protein
MERHAERTARVIPIIMRSCDWTQAPFNKLQALPRNAKPVKNWADQDEAFTNIATEIRNVIAEMSPQSFRTQRQEIFSLPFPRNKFFTGREDILTKLHQNFNAGERVQALNGLGGIGKTQTAAEYAYRYQQDYKAVLWAGASTRETLVTDYVAIAELLNRARRIRAKAWRRSSDGSKPIPAGC